MRLVMGVLSIFKKRKSSFARRKKLKSDREDEKKLVYKVQFEWNDKRVNTVEIYQDGSFKYIWAPVGHEDDPELQELCRQILKTYESDSKDDVKTLREMRDLNRNGRYTVSAMRHMLPIPYKGGSSEYEDAFLTLYAICCGSKPHYVTETPKKPECFENPGGTAIIKSSSLARGNLGSRIRDTGICSI